MLAVRLIGVLALIALNGFFAATEFSLVAVRLSRVRQLVAKGNARARVVEALLGDLHRVVSGVQLGITLTSLAIGALGEATFAKMIQAIWPRGLGAHTALFAHAIALACAFALLSALHVVIGELVPKTLSLARAERVALLVALPFRWFLFSCRFGLCEGFWDAAEPLDLRLVVAFHVCLAVSPAVKDGKTLFLLFCQCFTQLRHHGRHHRADPLFVGTIAV